MKVLADTVNGFHNLSGCLFSRVGSTAFIGTHLTFIDACIFSKSTDVQEVKVVKERGHIIFEYDIYYARGWDPFLPGFLQ